MKVLFILAKDSANFSSSKLIAAFLKAGHEVEAYGKFFEDVNIYMFKDSGIDIKPYDDLKDERVAECDIIFAHTVYMGDSKITTKKYTFFFNHIFMYGHENNSDFVFTQCDDPYNEFSNKVVMKVGSPKFDRIVEDECPAKDSKDILFIETGHFPFGKEGRVQLATLLLKMAKSQPTYRFVVKPRFLPNDVKNTTRKNSDHLYNYILDLCDGELPKNLVLLQEYISLEELIYKSHSIICYASSSYLEAALSGRGLVIIDGIQSREANSERKEKYWKAFNQFMHQSGCVVPYDKVLDYLPDGIICDEKHLEEAVYYRGNTAERIVEVVEYVWDAFLSKGRIPARGKYEYNTYKEMLKEDSCLTLQALQEDNVYDVLVYEIQRKERAVNADVSFADAYEQLTQWKATGELLKVEQSELINQLQVIIHKIFVANQSKLFGDRIDEAILLRSMDFLGMEEEILKFKEEKFVSKEAFAFYSGKHQYLRKQFDAVPSLMHDYLSYVKETKFNESFLCHAGPTKAAFRMALISLVYLQREEDINQFVDIMKAIENNKLWALGDYKKDCISYCNKHGDSDIAIRLESILMKG